MMIRRADESDVPVMMEFLEANHAKYFAPFGMIYDAATAHQTVKKILPLSVVFVAEKENGELEGLIAGFVRRDVLNERVKVYEEYAWLSKRTGVGDELLAEVDAYCQQNKIRHLIMSHMTTSSPRIEGKYKKAGLKPFEKLWIKTYA